MSGEPATSRLFLALWPSPGVRGALREWRDGWQWPRGATPVHPERLHMTLHFLGAVANERLPELVEGLRVPFSPFELRFGHPVLWPHGVAVLEPDTAPKRLLQLQEGLGGALQRLALPVEARPFRPHVTLARRANAALPPMQGPPIRWRVGSYALMESRLGAGGGYSVIQRYA
jgi:2'-5' RNA ligase